MSRGDGTGPQGMGPMTGRAAGYCAGFKVPGFRNPPTRFGTATKGRYPQTPASTAPDPLFRTGRGFRGGFGRGRGAGRGAGRLAGGGFGNYGRGRGYGRSKVPIAPGYQPPTNYSYLGSNRNLTPQFNRPMGLGGKR